MLAISIAMHRFSTINSVPSGSCAGGCLLLVHTCNIPYASATNDNADPMLWARNSSRSAGDWPYSLCTNGQIAANGDGMETAAAAEEKAEEDGNNAADDVAAAVASMANGDEEEEEADERIVAVSTNDSAGGSDGDNNIAADSVGRWTKSDKKAVNLEEDDKEEEMSVA